MATPRTSFLLPEALKAGLAALKARDGIAESEAIRRAIAEYLERKGIRPVSLKRGSVR